ncbi:hypothetical protein BpHYR1_020665 [Brachionus plicatilis]|uniref:Uncharacterized protein n=1 Tax=Brachionus plicatilis TaxID=10195 RepID=A0A3M7T747_BRAPC|nr:hypothetical protein BpHYR1_020665 [Brachionus plicatilis]
MVAIDLEKKMFSYIFEMIDSTYNLGLNMAFIKTAEIILAAQNELALKPYLKRFISNTINISSPYCLFQTKTIASNKVSIAQLKRFIYSHWNIFND